MIRLCKRGGQLGVLTVKVAVAVRFHVDLANIAVLGHVFPMW